MKTLSIDIETYSDEPLQKTGVYRYVESPNFEILLYDHPQVHQPICQKHAGLPEIHPPAEG